jgi:hypothetical protein
MRISEEQRAEKMMYFAHDFRHALDNNESTSDVCKKYGATRRYFHRHLPRYKEAWNTIFADGKYSPDVFETQQSYGNAKTYTTAQRIDIAKQVQQHMLGGLTMHQACRRLNIGTTIVVNWMCVDSGIEHIIEVDGTYLPNPIGKVDPRTLEGNPWSWAVSKLKERKVVQRIGQTIRKYRFDGRHVIEMRRNLTTKLWDIEEVANLTKYDLKAKDWIEAT